MMLLVLLVALEGAHACKCQLIDGGCKITEAAAKGNACQCTKMTGPLGFVSICMGKDIPKEQSNNKDSSLINKPDLSFGSCWLGKGCCDGYKKEDGTKQCCPNCA